MNVKLLYKKHYYAFDILEDTTIEYLKDIAVKMFNLQKDNYDISYNNQVLTDLPSKFKLKNILDCHLTNHIIKINSSDECEGENNLKEIINSIKEINNNKPKKVKELELKQKIAKLNLEANERFSKLKGNIKKVDAKYNNELTDIYLFREKLSLQLKKIKANLNSLLDLSLKLDTLYYNENDMPLLQNYEDDIKKFVVDSTDDNCFPQLKILEDNLRGIKDKLFSRINKRKQFQNFIINVLNEKYDFFHSFNKQMDLILKTYENYNQYTKEINKFMLDIYNSSQKENNTNDINEKKQYFMKYSFGFTIANTSKKSKFKKADNLTSDKETIDETEKFKYDSKKDTLTIQNNKSHSHSTNKKKTTIKSHKKIHLKTEEKIIFTNDEMISTESNILGNKNNKDNKIEKKDEILSPIYSPNREMRLFNKHQTKINTDDNYTETSEINKRLLSSRNRVNKLPLTILNKNMFQPIFNSVHNSKSPSINKSINFNTNINISSNSYTRNQCNTERNTDDKNYFNKCYSNNLNTVTETNLEDNANNNNNNLLENNPDNKEKIIFNTLKNENKYLPLIKTKYNNYYHGCHINSKSNSLFKDNNIISLKKIEFKIKLKKDNQINNTNNNTNNNSSNSISKNDKKLSLLSPLKLTDKSKEKISPKKISESHSPKPPEKPYRLSDGVNEDLNERIEKIKRLSINLRKTRKEEEQKRQKVHRLILDRDIDFENEDSVKKPIQTDIFTERDRVIRATQRYNYKLNNLGLDDDDDDSSNSSVSIKNQCGIKFSPIRGKRCIKRFDTMKDIRNYKNNTTNDLDRNTLKVRHGSVIVNNSQRKNCDNNNENKDLKSSRKYRRESSMRGYKKKKNKNDDKYNFLI